MQKSLAVVIVALAFSILCRSGKANDQTNKQDLLTPPPFSLTPVIPDQPVIQTQSVSAPTTTNAPVRAILQLPNGMVYEGEVLGALPHGHGVLTDQYGSKQRGEWRNGNAYKISGKTVYPDGTVEVGTWNADGSKSGGTITWKNGQVYKGDWKLTEGAPEVPDGNGEMIWPDGRKYVGQFRNGKMYGPGKMKYPDGKVEDGSWKDDKFLGAAH